MSSLRANFDELRERIRHGRDLGHASFEPIYYLVFHPSQILEVKRETPAWVAKLRNDGWQVQLFSLATEIADLLGSHPLRKIWLAGDRRAPLDWAKTNQSLRQALTQGDALQQRLEAALSKLDNTPNAILLVTDLEALHPYCRIGALESRLQGQFRVPTVFLYPGVRSGRTRLSFLGFYPEDGNYRSVHVGG
ncbi:BREX protein BrxB domain-containing protein [Methylolobus aquaticus]